MSEENFLTNKTEDESCENIKNDLFIFIDWFKSINLDNDLNNLYRMFSAKFNQTYRTNLFENICIFFNNQQFITDEILYYWKILVISILRNNKKYLEQISNLNFSLTDMSTNLKLVKEKYIFKCFLDNDYLCLFKENGNDYYVS